MYIPLPGEAVAPWLPGLFTVADLDEVSLLPQVFRLHTILLHRDVVCVATL